MISFSAKGTWFCVSCKPMWTSTDGGSHATSLYPWQISLLAGAGGHRDRDSSSACRKDRAADREVMEELAHVPRQVLACHPGGTKISP